ncbi:MULTISPECIES: response regulator transcription factor [unclassified Bacillus (in: firmicutes)]|uniref:response regulator transcription factor n=1 Tax=unclassified Bacillus (in: firmicutes) TaxID=185979 RepID=UPI00232F88C2|nr:LuxR C-terminal-related transcriptional regulator [Bacillus sp. BP-3]MDC2865517.1 LuxR C-terminal-related transcriptional regulator [Bacillus sp. BP-3]
MKRKKILVAVQNVKGTSIYSEIAASGRFQTHILNNKYMLKDPSFLSTFDIVIADIANYNILKGMVIKAPHLIVLISSKERHLFSMIEGVEAIVKKGDSHEIVEALTAIEKNEFYISDEFRLLFSWERKSVLLNKLSFQKEDLSDLLTKTELRVMRELINDKTNQQIADTLYLSKRTVEYHIAACMRKLEVKSRVGLAVKVTRAILLRGQQYEYNV